jgi:hypothetical protein
MKRLGTSFGSAEPQEPYPLPCLNFEPYNLNHVSVFSVTLRLSCLSLASLPLTYPSRHHLIQGCWLINIRDSVFSFISLYCRTNHFTLFQSFVFTKVCFAPPPPPLGLVTHFSLSSTLFTFLTSFSRLFALFVASVASVRFWVSRTYRGCGRSAVLLTHGQHHTRTQAIKHVCGGFPPKGP